MHLGTHLGSRGECFVRRRHKQYTPKQVTPDDSGRPTPTTGPGPALPTLLPQNRATISSRGTCGKALPRNNPQYALNRRRRRRQRTYCEKYRDGSVIRLAVYPQQYSLDRPPTHTLRYKFEQQLNLVHVAGCRVKVLSLLC